MRTIWVGLLAITVAFVAAAGSAKAGTGGAFRDECPDGSYLTGFDGRADDLIDHIRIVCARWNAALGTLGQPFTNSEDDAGAGRSGGGVPKREDCPSGWLVEDLTQIQLAPSRDGLVLHTIYFQCRTPGEPFKLQSASFGSRSELEVAQDRSDVILAPGSCYPGEVATGIQGKHSEFISHFILTCAKAPAWSVAGAKVNDAAKAKSYNSKWAVSGASRVGNDIIVASGAAEPNMPPASPQPVEKAETTNDTDVYRRVVLKNETVIFQRLDDDPAHFLPKGFVAQLLAKEGGWWKLDLKDVAFVKGEGWVAADQLKPSK